MALLAKQVDLGQIGGDGKGLGPFTDVSNAIAKVATLISNLLAFFTILAGLWFIFQFVVGAYQWLSSGGDKAHLESARNRLAHAFIGLIIVVAAWAIIAVVGVFLGLDILLTKPAKITCLINPTITDKALCPQ